MHPVSEMFLKASTCVDPSENMWVDHASQQVLWKSGMIFLSPSRYLNVKSVRI